MPSQKQVKPITENEIKALQDLRIFAVAALKLNIVDPVESVYLKESIRLASILTDKLIDNGYTK